MQPKCFSKVETGIIIMYTLYCFYSEKNRKRIRYHIHIVKLRD